MSDSVGLKSCQATLQVSITAALEAGKILRQEFHRPGGPRGESSHALLDADVEALIRDRLTAAFPTYGVRGEELHHLNRQPQDLEQHLWLIDPNDGTASYLKGYRGAAFSIALLRSGIPVLGVVYVYCAPNGEGDLFAWAERCGSLQRNGQPVQRIWADELSTKHTVLVSQAGDNNSLANAQVVAPARFRTIPSIAYRLALVAAGEAEAAVSLNGSQDWDYAAGHALLRGVGGELFDRNGQPVTYSVQGESHCGGTCVGGSVQIAPKLAVRNWQPVLKRSHPASEPYELVNLEPGQSIEDSGLLARAQGCLLGQFTGDALGSLVEFETVEEISLYRPQGVEFLEDGGTWNTIAGQPTDDSELALMLARSLIKSGHFDLNAIAQSYAYWYKSHPFDIGNAIGRAFSGISREIESGADPVEAASRHSNQNSQANGALMRISPLAIFGNATAEETLAEWARADARLSHPHPVCQDANAVLVIAIRYALRTGATPAEVYQYTRTWAESTGVHPDICQTLNDAAQHPPLDYERHMGWVRIALHNAFYQLLHTDSFSAGVINSVMQGGDSDTNGAISGALLGAVYGYHAVPLQWRDRILTCRPLAGLPNVYHPRPKPFWPVDALEIAETLLMGSLKSKIGIVQ